MKGVKFMNNITSNIINISDDDVNVHRADCGVLRKPELRSRVSPVAYLGRFYEYGF